MNPILENPPGKTIQIKVKEIQRKFTFLLHFMPVTAVGASTPATVFMSDDSGQAAQVRGFRFSPE
jgi:hypothetical protein